MPLGPGAPSHPRAGSGSTNRRRLRWGRCDVCHTRMREDARPVVFDATHRDQTPRQHAVHRGQQHRRSEPRPRHGQVAPLQTLRRTQLHRQVAAARRFAPPTRKAACGPSRYSADYRPQSPGWRCLPHDLEGSGVAAPCGEAHERGETGCRGRSVLTRFEKQSSNALSAMRMRPLSS